MMRVFQLLLTLSAMSGGLSSARAEDWRLVVKTGDVEDIAGRHASIDSVWGIFVGVSKYELTRYYPDLPNARRDALDLAAALEARCGLKEPEVLLDEQATLPGLRQALQRIARKAGPDDLFVFHFSGHGQGWKSSETAEARGLLLLHDAPSTSEMRIGHFGSGVVDLSLLDRELSNAGIRAKHRLIVLDSCYGGLGAYSRDPTFVVDGIQTATYQLLRPATYVISAGGTEQQVFDGPQGGHGLLTRFFLEVLRSGGAVSIPSIHVSGRDYLPVSDLFRAAQRWIPAWAAAIREQNALGRGANQSRSGMTDPAAQPQIPQDMRRGGAGQVFLPLFQYSSSSGPVAVAESSPGASSAAMRSAGSESTWSALRDWTQAAGSAYGNRGYGEAWGNLLDRLEQGPSPEPNPVGGELVAELLVRPSVSAMKQLLKLPGSPPAQCEDPEGIFREESLYDRVRGASWVRPGSNGALITAQHEVALVAANRSTMRVYPHVLALDSIGSVQLPMAMLGSPLRGIPPSRWQVLPCATQLDQKIAFRGWPMQGSEGRAQILLVAFTSQPWPEIDVAMRSVEVEWRKIQSRTDFIPRRLDGFALMAAAPSRFGEHGLDRLTDPDEFKGLWPANITPIACGLENGYTGFGWAFQVAAGKDAKLELISGP